MENSTNYDEHVLCSEKVVKHDAENPHNVLFYQTDSCNAPMF